MVISVIIAAYKGEKYIAEQLQSLFRQTRLPDEILIGDDSPDDLTRLAIESVRAEYSGVLRYIKNPVRLGFVQNFVNLARLAEGDCIFFCDQDDVWLPDKIERLSDILEKDPECQVAACNSEMTDENLQMLHESLLCRNAMLTEWEKSIGKGEGFEPVLKQTICLPGHNLAMRKSFKEIFFQIPKEYRYHDIWIVQTAAALGVLRFTGQSLTLFRIHGRNASSPELQKTKKNLFRRWKEIRNSSEDLLYFSSLLSALRTFLQNYPDNPNRELTEQYDRFFADRCKLLQHNRFYRLCRLLFSPERRSSYFRYGWGMRSILRDLSAKGI